MPKGIKGSGIPKVTKVGFDSSKNYKWEPKDKFTLTGLQFASLYHALHQEINAPGGATIAMKIEAHNVVMDILKRGVVRGKITEVGDVATISDLAERADGMFAVKDSTPKQSEESTSENNEKE